MSGVLYITGLERNGREFSAGEAETDDGVSRSHRLPPPRLPLRARLRADRRRRRRTRRQQAPYEGRAVDEPAPRPLLPHCESTPTLAPWPVTHGRTAFAHAHRATAFQDHRQFKQRYFEFLDYHRAPGGPVFLRICGESACDGIPNDYLAVSCNSHRTFSVSHTPGQYSVSC